ncbi:MAG: 1-acyl-sn-glycerol-3-phosphate acyltransferase [Oscillospiraceae bacterium]|nr:1-acyl-sn-glycerol-3-phosphate acyltransferase [Oscillospiraceae bacterium]
MSAYKFWYCLTWPLVKLIFPYTVRGRENICEGAALVCCNHSSLLDPVFVGGAFGRNEQLFFMAKSELFENFFLAKLFGSVGAFPVKRGEMDINAMRTCIAHLKSDEKVMLFPEGTRVSEEEHIAAKTGAVRLSLKHDVPIIPMYLSSKKKAFRRSYVVIGKPFKFEKPAGKDYTTCADELLRRIYELEPKP